MPAHNAQDTIRAAAISTLRALPQDAQLSILDDASTDDTAAIVRDLARTDNRVRLLDGFPTQLGVADALNALLHDTSTTLIARMDADDITIPGRFTRQLRGIAECDVHFTSAVFYGPGRHVEPVPVLASTPRSSMLELLCHNPFFHPAMLARRAAIAGVNGYRAVPTEDWDLFMRLVLDGRSLVRSGVPGVLYRRHGSQVSATQWWKEAAGADPRAAQVHDELSQVVFDADVGGAFAALAGGRASPDEVRHADWLISRIANTVNNFRGPSKLSLRVTVHGARLRLHKRYGTYLKTRPASDV